MQRDAELLYLARQKVKGVPHHAKAGNINNALLKESPGHGDYILVLDCDMIAHPDFLMRTLGHFYRWMPTGCGQEGTKDCLDDCGLPVGLLNDKYETDAVAAAAAPKGSWVLKEKAAFIQTPQVMKCKVVGGVGSRQSLHLCEPANASVLVCQRPT